MEFKYCPTCGKRLILKEIGDEGLLPYCEVCKKPYFDVFNTCVIVTVINQFNEVILLKQNYVSSNWVLVAGYIRNGESAEESVIKEVLEETGQTVKEIEYVKSYFHLKRNLLMLGYTCKVDKENFNNSPEVDDIGWFKIDEAFNLMSEGSVAKKLLGDVLKNKY